MQRNFEPMRRQVEGWRSRQISTVAAKLIIYQACESRSSLYFTIAHALYLIARQVKWLTVFG
jgi:hypothetical protein